MGLAGLSAAVPNILCLDVVDDVSSQGLDLNHSGLCGLYSCFQFIAACFSVRSGTGKRVEIFKSLFLSKYHCLCHLLDLD